LADRPVYVLELRLEQSADAPGKREQAAV